MENSVDIRGVICSLITPFDQHFRVDYASIRQHIDFLLAHGIHGLMIGGTTGEGLLLSLDERKMLTELVLKHVADQVPVIVHTGCITTADTLHLTRHANDVGATAVAVIVPYYYTFDDSSLFDHFVSVAHSVPDLPIFPYTFPDNARNDISPPLLKRLRRAALNITGIKSSNPDLLCLQDYSEVGGKGFTVLGGTDGLMLANLVLGAQGQVSGNANAFPELFRALYDAFEAGNMNLARTKQEKINRLRLVLKDGLHPAYFKAALALRGISAGRVRRPMRELRQEELSEMERGLRKLELL